MKNGPSMIGTEQGATESAAQFLGMWTALAEDRGACVTEDRGLTTCWPHVGFASYNALSFADPRVDRAALEARLHHAAAFMRDRARKGFLWLFEELLAPDAYATLEELIEDAGLINGMTCWGMAGDVLPLAEPHHPALRFERVSTDAHLDAYAALNARAYDVPEDGAYEALRGSDLWRGGIHAYLGYEGDTPVACAGTYPVDGRLFVIMVATERGYERRGFGEAVTRTALHEGAKATGLQRATLQATAAGRPVYERIGLQCTAQVQCLTLRDSA